MHNIFEHYLNKNIDYDGIDIIERSIKNGIRIYQKNILQIKIKEL